MPNNDAPNALAACARCGSGMVKVTPCILCGEPAVLWVNGSRFCEAHREDGFHLTIKGVAIANGATDEEAEQIDQWATAMVNTLRVDDA